MMATDRCTLCLAHGTLPLAGIAGIAGNRLLAGDILWPTTNAAPRNFSSTLASPPGTGKLPVHMNRFPIRSLFSSFTSPRFTNAAIAFASLALLAIFAFSFVSSETITAKDEPAKMLRHVVLFKFKDTSSAEDVQKVVDAFRGLKSKIPEVASFEYGTDNSPEGLANGFTHCFLITFKTEADRAVYLPHPAHKAFVDVLKPHLDKVQVIDYWAKD